MEFDQHNTLDYMSQDNPEFQDMFRAERLNMDYAVNRNIYQQPPTMNPQNRNSANAADAIDIHASILPNNKIQLFMTNNANAFNVKLLQFVGKNLAALNANNIFFDFIVVFPEEMDAYAESNIVDFPMLRGQNMSRVGTQNITQYLGSLLRDSNVIAAPKNDDIVRNYMQNEIDNKLDNEDTDGNQNTHAFQQRMHELTELRRNSGQEVQGAVAFRYDANNPQQAPQYAPQHAPQHAAQYAPQYAPQQAPAQYMPAPRAPQYAAQQPAQYAAQYAAPRAPQYGSQGTTDPGAIAKQMNSGADDVFSRYWDNNVETPM
jgi:hypothetical protein